MDSIAHLIREEEDFMFIRGERKGEQQGERKAKTAIVTKLLRQSDWSVEQIAEIVEVSVELVEQVRHELNG